MNNTTLSGASKATASRNTQFSQAGGNTTDFFEILEFPSVDVQRQRGAIIQRFGYPDGWIYSGLGLLQESWICGLHIHYEYIAPGIANLIVATTQKTTQEAYLQVFDALSRKPLPRFQGVLA